MSTKQEIEAEAPETVPAKAALAVHDLLTQHGPLIKDAMQRAKDEAARKEREALKAKAAAAPDREKLKAFAVSVACLQLPEMATEEGKAKAREIAAKVRGFSKWINERVEELP